MEVIRSATALVCMVTGAIVVFNIGYSLWLLAVGVCARAAARCNTNPWKAKTRFCVLIPAHDEELVLPATLSALQGSDYPPELRKTVVIADNCSDKTASIARSFNNVEVLERHCPERRGKGYALNWALEQLAPASDIDSFVIVDADTRVDARFLAEMDQSRQRHSSELFAAQGRYDVFNADESWRTALVAGALSLVHVVRPLGRERLGLTTGLKGNGMAFDLSVLEKVPWSGNSLTEDVEYTLDILQKLDVRVHFVPNARVAALMPTTATGAESQRQRWETGRRNLVQRKAAEVFLQGVRSRNFALIDAAIELVSLPLADLATLWALWTVSIAVLAVEGGNWTSEGAVAAGSFLGLALYVVGGFAVGDAPAEAYRALVFAPFYALWKIALRLKTPPSGPRGWVRTAREPSSTSTTGRK